MREADTSHSKNTGRSRSSRKTLVCAFPVRAGKPYQSILVCRPRAGNDRLHQIPSRDLCAWINIPQTFAGFRRAQAPKSRLSNRLVRHEQWHPAVKWHPRPLVRDSLLADRLHR